MYSMHGLPHSDTIGLGWLLVSGRRRVPSPPAMTTARTRHLGWSGTVRLAYQMARRAGAARQVVGSAPRPRRAQTTTL